MPKFLLTASYTAEGTKGVMKEGGSARKAAAEQVMKSVGAKIEAFYFGFGDADAIMIVDAPDTVTAVALSLAVNSTGRVAVRTTPLITVEEMDAAAKKSVSYRPPGA
jgi:uncharacterized protein with GYD domain